MDNMKTTKGIACNEYIHTVKATKDRIEFKFVNKDQITPSRVSIGLGDKDPMTGEIITDMTFFTEYYKLADHQIYVNRKETRNRYSLEGLISDEGKSKVELEKNYSIPTIDPFAENEADDILSLREVADSLTGRLADIYEALLVQYAGGQERITMTELARKWGVSVTTICKDRDRIIRMIRKAIKG